MFWKILDQDFSKTVSPPPQSTEKNIMWNNYDSAQNWPSSRDECLGRSKCCEWHQDAYENFFTNCAWGNKYLNYINWWKFHHHLLALMTFQTCMIFFPLWNKVQIFTLHFCTMKAKAHKIIKDTIISSFIAQISGIKIWNTRLDDQWCQKSFVLCVY